MESFPCSFVSIIGVSRYERQINTKARQAATARKRTNFSSFSISKLKLFANYCTLQCGWPPCTWASTYGKRLHEGTHNTINMQIQTRYFLPSAYMHTCTTFNSMHNQMLKILGVFHIWGVDFFFPNELTSFIIYLGINISVYSNWRKPTWASRCSCRHVGSSSLIMLSTGTAESPSTIIHASLEKRLMANFWYWMCPWTKPRSGTAKSRKPVLYHPSWMFPYSSITSTLMQPHCKFAWEWERLILICIRAWGWCEEQNGTELLLCTVSLG